jgi:uncharacterized protein (TIGR04255 family)
VASEMAIARQWHKDGHAIVQASFAVEFAAPPPPATVRELLALHPKLKDRYPRRQESRALRIPVDALETEHERTVVGQPVVGGFNFDSLMPDGTVERSIVLNDKTLTITRSEYELWHKTWVEVRFIFAFMLPILMQRGIATTFHLQYQNRFVWEGDLSAFRADTIFRSGSQFLAPNVFDAPELWHSNHGYFEYPNGNHQLLSTADVQAVLPERLGVDADAGWGVVVEVRLGHRAIHGVERAGSQGTPITTEEEMLGAGEDGEGLLDRYMNEMHARNNWLMARLINDEMCERIALPRPE